MTEPANILIVEDEAHLAQGLLFNLQAEGYRASIAGDGASALELLLDGAREDGDFDAVLLDVMLPGKDGFQVLAELREHERYVPVLMLTARGRPEDVLRGFTAGADDYLAKPFDLNILLARLKNLLRRMTWHSRTDGPKPAAGETPEDASFRFAGRTIDFSKLELITPEKTIHLTLMESDLLRYLVQNRGRIVSRKELLEQVWRVREDTDTRAIDNFIVRLRRYLEDQPSDPVYLQTVRGVGYRFLPDAADLLSAGRQKSYQSEPTSSLSASRIGVGGICMSEVNLRIEGMHCGACIRRVTQSLQAVPGVEVEEVRLGAARVKLDRGASIEAVDSRTGQRRLRRTRRRGVTMHIAESPSTESSQPKKTAELKTITIPVLGMSCAACQSHVERALRQTHGVDGAKVNLMTHTARVAFDPQLASPQNLVEAVKNSGYESSLPPDTNPLGTNSAGTNEDHSGEHHHHPDSDPAKIRTAPSSLWPWRPQRCFSRCP